MPNTAHGVRMAFDPLPNGGWRYQGRAAVLAPELDADHGPDEAVPFQEKLRRLVREKHSHEWAMIDKLEANDPGIHGDAVIFDLVIEVKPIRK